MRLPSITYLNTAQSSHWWWEWSEEKDLPKAGPEVVQAPYPRPVFSAQSNIWTFMWGHASRVYAKWTTYWLWFNELQISFFHSLIHIEKKEHRHRKVSLCAQMHKYPVDIQDLFIGQEIRFDCKDNYNPHTVCLDLQSQMEQMRVSIGAGHQKTFMNDLVCWFVPNFAFFFRGI